jgi:hypothetical protein
VQNKVDEIINLLNATTKPEGPIHPNNETELNIWNLPGWYYFLRQGKYPEAEKIYKAFYEKLLEQQKISSRLHKGMPIHNLALSLFFQGKTEDAIKFFVCAYIEDVIRGKGSEEIEQGAASRVLRGLCGVPQAELFEIRDVVLQKIEREIPLNPEIIYDSPEIGTAVSRIQKRYKENIPDTWKLEKDGQLALEKGDYEKSYEVYQTWFLELLEYQKIIKNRVHKGHPLFNSGLSRFMEGKREEAFNLFLLAYIEDAVSALHLGDADKTAAFTNLSTAPGVIDSLREIERSIFRMKTEGEDLSDPRIIAQKLAVSQKRAEKEFEEQKKTIMSTRDQRKKELIERISRVKEIDDQINNTIYILKRWNSSTPRYPPEEPESLGGGYFLVWNKKGIVIDLGYDFLKIFYNEGFRPRNIDLVIVTHAHDDHCQDLEAIFSVLYKLNNCNIKHKIDLVISEGVQIKYNRLLTIMKDFVSNEILQQGGRLDPTKIFGNQYNLEIQATKTVHNEEPWMKNNTGFGLLLSLKKDSESPFKIGLTGDTTFWNGIDKEFSGVDLLIEHIGTYGISKNHLCEVGCLELLKRAQPAPKLVVVSEFGEELNGHRVEICTQMETLANRQTIESNKIPVIAGDIGLRIKIPNMEVFCRDTKQFEDYNQVIDKEFDGKIQYFRRE